MSYAVFGDSYITRLERFTKGNMHFRHRCKFFGVGEMSTKKKFQPMFDSLLAYRPRFVFLNLGGNNIERTCDPKSIFEDLVYIVQELKLHSVERVFVASIVHRGLFPGWTGMTESSFKQIRRAVNAKLKKYFRVDYVDIEKKLRYPKHYDDDMVHPGYKEGGLKVLRDMIHRNFSKTS